jgi:hypothetical protein
MLTTLVRLMLSQSTTTTTTTAYELEGRGVGVFGSILIDSVLLSHCRSLLCAAVCGAGGMMAAAPVLLSGGRCRVSGQVPCLRVAAHRHDVGGATERRCDAARRGAMRAFFTWLSLQPSPLPSRLASTATASSVAAFITTIVLATSTPAPLPSCFDEAAPLAPSQPMDVPHAHGSLPTADLDSCRPRRWPSRSTSAVSVAVGVHEVPGGAQVRSLALLVR